MSIKIEKLKRKAREHEQREEWSQALELYQRALDESVDQDDTEIALHNRIGDLQIRLGDREGAATSYERAIDLYLEGDLPNNAMAVCRKLQRNTPHRASTLLRMGQIRVQQGFVVDARQNFLSYAEAQVAAGRGEEGLRALEEFASLAPEDVQVRVFLATFLEQQDRTDEAVEHLRAAYRHLREQGDDQEAADVRTRVQEMAPGVDVEAEALSQEAREAAEASQEEAFAELPMEWPEPDVPQAGEGKGEWDDLLTGDDDPLTVRDDPVSGPDDHRAGGDDPLGGHTVELEPADGGFEPKAGEAPAGDEREGYAGFASEELDTLEGGYDWVHDTPSEPRDHGEDSRPVTESASPFPSSEPSPVGQHGAETFDAAMAEEDGFRETDESASDESVPPEPAYHEPVSGELAPVAPGDDDTDTPDGDLSWDALPEEDESWEDPEPLPLLEDAPVAPEPPAPSPAPSPTPSPGPGTRETLLRLRARVTRDPGDAEAWRSLGAVLLDEGMEEEARIALRKAHETYADQGDPERAMRVVRDLIFLDPDHLDLHKRLVEYAHQTGDRALLVPAFVELAEVLARSGAGRKSEAVYGQILALDPRNPRALRALADLAGGDEEEAAAPTAPTPDSPTPPPLETQAAEDVDAPEESVAASDSPKSDPESPEADFVNLGGMVLDAPAGPAESFRWKVPVTDPSGDEEADFARMLAQFKEKVARDLPSDDVIARYDLGAAFKEMGLLDEAISEFQQVIRSKPRHLASYEMLGQCFLEKGEAEVALRLLRKALDVGHEVEDELLGIYYFLAQSYASAGNPQSAREFYERVFSLDINFRDVTERLRELR